MHTCGDFAGNTYNLLTYEFGGYAYTNLKFLNGEKMTAGMHRIIMGDREPYKGWAVEHGVLEVEMPNGLVLFKGNVRSGGNKRLTVDHIDGDGLNNTRANLRFATASEQMKNRCKCRDRFGSYYLPCTCRTDSVAAPKHSSDQKNETTTAQRNERNNTASDDVEERIAKQRPVSTCGNTKCGNCGHPQTKVRMMIIDAPCWSCTAKIKVAVVAGDAAREREIGPDDFTDHELFVAEDHGVTIDYQWSRTIGRSYLANSCKCGAFIGNFYLLRDYSAPAQYGELRFTEIDLGYSCHYCADTAELYEPDYELADMGFGEDDSIL